MYRLLVVYYIKISCIVLDNINIVDKIKGMIFIVFWYLKEN